MAAVLSLMGRMASAAHLLSCMDAGRTASELQVGPDALRRHLLSP